MILPKKKKRVIFSGLLLFFTCFGLFVWWPDYQWSHSYPQTEGNSCTIFLIDGLSSEIFKAEPQAGHLPVMEKMINENVFTENGISSVPTMTGYGFYPFITGIDATKSGILGLRWFDRKRKEGNLRNYVGRTNIHMNDASCGRRATARSSTARSAGWRWGSFPSSPASRGGRSRDICSTMPSHCAGGRDPRHLDDPFWRRQVTGAG